ncbi:unnamed protein product, partial [Brenthis ino]
MSILFKNIVIVQDTGNTKPLMTIAFPIADITGYRSPVFICHFHAVVVWCRCQFSNAAVFFIFNKMPLQLTKPAPQFKTTAVVNGEFKDVALSDYKGKYVVLFFYPLDFTFVCPTEIIAFSERADDFRKIGCEVIGASTDSHFTHLAWINTPRKQGGLGPMNIPLISDKSHRISRDYGVLDEESGIPFRGLFIIDDKQNLRQITINDLPVGRSVDETLRLVQAFQFTDKHGEVCPANWTPGAKTIKPDTKAAQEYFVDAN